VKKTQACTSTTGLLDVFNRRVMQNKIPEVAAALKEFLVVAERVDGCLLFLGPVPKTTASKNMVIGISIKSSEGFLSTGDQHREIANVLLIFYAFRDLVVAPPFSFVPLGAWYPCVTPLVL